MTAGAQHIAAAAASDRLGIAHGRGAERLAAQADRIDALNAAGHSPFVLKGVEVDILEDGAVDLPDAVLGRLGLVVGAIHSHFDLSTTRQTTRILRAIATTLISRSWRARSRVCLASATPAASTPRA